MPRISNGDSSSEYTNDPSGDESRSSGNLSTRKRRRLANASQLDLCQEIFDAIRANRSDDVSPVDMFMRLPTKRSHPDYYEAIKKPIDLARIQVKIKSGDYETVDDMAADIQLLVTNAKAFYPTSTTEFAKAVELQEVFDQERQNVQTVADANTKSNTSSVRSTVTPRGGRKRKRRQIEDDDADSIESASVIASEAASETSTTNMTVSSQRSSGESPYDLLFAAIAKYTLDDGRNLATTFTYLPARELYPVYYDVIENPIDLRMIAKRIQSETYTSMDELDRDFMLMSRNAKMFNEPKSSIYRDAKILSKILKGKRRESEHPPSRTNKERGRRASRLSYNAHSIVEEYASLPDEQINTSFDDLKPDLQIDVPTPKIDDESATSTTGTESPNATSVPLVKKKRGRPPKNPPPSTPVSPSVSRELKESLSPPPISSPISPFSDSSSIAPETVKSNDDSILTACLSARHTTAVCRYRVGSERWKAAQVLQAVLDARGESGHIVCAAFSRLPSRKKYLDYYQLIANPICLADMKKKLKHNEYPTLDSVMFDLNLVFKNAQQYNVEDSAIYKDSIHLQQVANRRYEEMIDYRPSPVKRIHSPLTTDSDYSRTSLDHSSGNSPRMMHRTPIRRSSRDPLSPEELKYKRLRNLYNAVYNHINEDGHRPRDVFLLLPSKEEYPDYYDVIPEPIDLTTIKRKIEHNEYTTHQELVADFRLMFNNARHYNEEGSGVYNDADTLDQVVKKRLRRFVTYRRTQPGVEQNVSSGSHGFAADSTGFPANVVAPTGSTQSQLQSTSGMPILQRVMLELFQTVREYHCNDRQLSALFMRLPTRAEMPTYYEFIKKPIELQTIARQLVQMRYTQFEEFAADLFLMFDNACAFNEPDSQIYADALTLHRVCLAKRSMILNTFAGHLGIPPAMPPDVQTGMRRLLTNLHNAMLTACDQDGRGLVDSLIAGDGTEATLTSVTAARLATLHRSVAAGSYRRLDRLQLDWLLILKRARIGEGDQLPPESKNPLPTIQQRLDAVELARRWIKLRDELSHRLQRKPVPASASDNSSTLPSHLVLLSPALNYTGMTLDRELLDEEEKFRLDAYGDESAEGVPPELAANEKDIMEVTLSNQLYHIHDFVYVAPQTSDNAQPQIGRILRIVQSSSQSKPSDVEQQKDEKTEAESDRPSEPSSTEVIVAWYLRPCDAHPSKRRRLLNSEIFRTALVGRISVNRLIGRCLVLHISTFVRFQPKNVPDRDVYICESQLSVKGQCFVKIQNWAAAVPAGFELEQRPVPFIPTRLPPSEPLENALEQVDTSKFTNVQFPIPRIPESVILRDQSDDPSGDIIYEQYVHQNGFLVKVGDFLYIPTALGSNERNIVRVDKLWKSTEKQTILFSGPWFVFPSAVEHLPTRVFYPKEVFFNSAEHATHALASATGKCIVMNYADYCRARPTELSEQDVYLCDSKYAEDEKVIRKLKKGLKKFELSDIVHEDEFYFLPQPILPRKDASPLLAQASSEPLNQDQLNLPASNAMSCTLAASSGVMSTPLAISDRSSADVSILPSSSAVDSPTMIKTPGTTMSLKLGDGDDNLTFEYSSDRLKKRHKLRKPPSGYVLYAGEVRRRLLSERRDAPFGEISREVGQLWRQLPNSQRDLYERKALVIKQRMEADEARLRAHEEAKQKLQQQQQQQQLASQFPGHQGFGPRPSAFVGNQVAVPPHMIAPGTVQPAGPSHMQVGTSASAGTMQFYQTPSGQVIQIMHAQPTNTTVHMNNQQASHVAVPFHQTGLPISSGGTAAIPHQIVYQLPGQPNAMVPSASSVASTTLHNQSTHLPQRVIIASNPGSTAVANSAILQTQPHLMLPSTAPFVSATSASGHAVIHPTSSVPVVSVHGQPMPAEFSIPTQSQFQMMHQTHSTVPHTPVAPSSIHATPFSSAAPPNIQAPVHIGSVQMQHARPPSPIFVSAPPRTSRVLHSEVYQRYINRLRKNATGGLSDWRHQLSVSKETAPNLAPPMANQVASNFLANPQNHSHQANVTEALWSLRDHLLEDALKIQLHGSNSVECL